MLPKQNAIYFLRLMFKESLSMFLYRAIIGGVGERKSYILMITTFYLKIIYCRFFKPQVLCGFMYLGIQFWQHTGTDLVYSLPQKNIVTTTRKNAFLPFEMGIFYCFNIYSKFSLAILMFHLWLYYQSKERCYILE